TRPVTPSSVPTAPSTTARPTAPDRPGPGWAGRRSTRSAGTGTPAWSCWPARYPTGYPASPCGWPRARAWWRWPASGAPPPPWPGPGSTRADAPAPGVRARRRPGDGEVTWLVTVCGGADPEDPRLLAAIHQIRVQMGI